MCSNVRLNNKHQTCVQLRIIVWSVLEVYVLQEILRLNVLDSIGSDNQKSLRQLVNITGAKLT